LGPSQSLSSSRRRRLAFQRQQVHVLADALVERSGAEQAELLAQKGDGLRPFSAGRERLGVDLDGGAQRRGEPAIAVQL
jgi:hypothetical protein